MKTIRGWMVLLGTLIAVGAAVPAQAQAPKVTVVSAEVKRPAEAENTTAVDDIMDAAIRELFQSAGCTVEVVPHPTDIAYLDDRTLADIGRATGAQWVVYPKILAMDPLALVFGRLPAGADTGMVLYGGVVDVSNPGRLKTVYMRQVGYPWSRPSAEPIFLAERTGIPTGVGYLFRYFDPLNRMMASRGMTTLTRSPEEVMGSIWTDERVAGFRQAFP